jgi:hypothetical protein
MPHESLLLCALFAPGSIEAEVGKVQAAVFSTHGMASALALPPLIPIAFMDAARVDRALLQEMNRSIAPGWRMRLTRAEWIGGHLFARVDSGAAWGALRARALERCGSEEGSPFPAAEGFYLGCSEAPIGARAEINPAIPGVSFGSATIVLMKIHAAFDAAGWWRELSWETVEERPLRGRKQL